MISIVYLIQNGIANHVVFAAKYRRLAFYGEKKTEIEKILRQLCEWKGVNIIEVETCPNHIHTLIEIPPKYSVAQRHMPIGYKLVEGKIQLGDSKANIVKHIFKEYVSGASLLDIAKAMAAAGLPNADNQPKWYHGTVSSILDNVKYQGDDFYPPLIDKELFEKVQRRRGERCEKLKRNLQLNSASR